MKDEIKETIKWLNQIIKENKEGDVSLKCCVIPFETLYKLQDCITNLQEKNERLNNIIKNLDEMFEYYFLGNSKYDQDTVNTIYIKYVKLKELGGDEE